MLRSTPLPKPKPKKSDRVDASNLLRQELQAFRRTQYKLAYERDKGKCVFCHEEAMDVHHVYGRGQDKNDWREKWTSLMCVCRECHPQPILGGPGTSAKLGYVEDKLHEINNNYIK